MQLVKATCFRKDEFLGCAQFRDEYGHKVSPGIVDGIIVQKPTLTKRTVHSAEPDENLTG